MGRDQWSTESAVTATDTRSSLGKEPGLPEAETEYSTILIQPQTSEGPVETGPSAKKGYHKD